MHEFTKHVLRKFEAPQRNSTSFFSKMYRAMAREWYIMTTLPVVRTPLREETGYVVLRETATAEGDNILG